MTGDDSRNRFLVGAAGNDGEWIVVCSQNPMVQLIFQGDKGELKLELDRLAGIKHAGYSFDKILIFTPESLYGDYVHK